MRYEIKSPCLVLLAGPLKKVFLGIGSSHKTQRKDQEAEICDKLTGKFLFGECNVFEDFTDPNFPFYHKGKKRDCEMKGPR